MSTKLVLTMESQQCLEHGPKETTEESGKDERKIQVEGPDGGYAWVVAIAACLINFIMAGLGRMSGILFVAFIELYGVDRKSASMPFSVRSSARNLIGPVVGILGQKYGARSITMIGGIVATTSAVACFFADDITWITVLWGGMNGLGNSLTVTLPQVVIGQYFDVYRTTASGMAFSGSCMASFVFPVIIEQLLHSYGIEGTFLIIAGIILHTIPAAMILKKPSWLKKRNDVESLKMDVSQPEKNLLKECEKQKGIDSVKILPKGTLDINFLRQQRVLVTKLLTTVSPNCTKPIVSEANSFESLLHLEYCLWDELEDLFSNIELSEMSHFQRNLLCRQRSLDSDMLIKKAGCTKGLNLASSRLFVPVSLYKSKSVPDLSKIIDADSESAALTKLKDLHGMKFSKISAAFPNEKKSLVCKVSKELKTLYKMVTKPSKLGNAFPLKPAASAQCTEIQNDSTEVHSNSFWDHMKTAIQLHSNPLFLLVCICRVVHFVAFIPVMTIVVDFVMDKGLLEQDGKYAIAALSLGDLVGRLCFGWVTDKGYLQMSKYMMIVMIAQGASTAFLPLMHTRATLFTVMCVFGMLQGSLFVRHPVLISKYMGSHEQSIAMGCVNFFSGILGFGLPIYIGYFRDTLGSYDCIFYINGTLGALVGLLWALEPYFQRCSALKCSSDEPEESV